MPSDGHKPCARDLLFDRGWILDEIRFAEAHGNNAPARECNAKASCNRFNLRKFWHG